MQLVSRSRDPEVRFLSGGNQQKVVLAKWLATEPSVIVLDEPTRGIDVGARRPIYELMRDLVAEGAAILMISSELPELIGMADRIVVLHEGRIAGELPGGERTTEEDVMALATGTTTRRSRRDRHRPAPAPRGARTAAGRRSTSAPRRSSSSPGRHVRRSAASSSPSTAATSCPRRTWSRCSRA